MANDGKLTTETSLVNALPGLKLEFKGNDSDKGDLSFLYKHKFATLTAEVDALNFSKANASLCGGHGPFTAGVSGDFKFPKGASAACDTVTVGASYTIPKSLFATISSKNFSDYTGLMEYAAAPNVTLAGMVKYNPKATCGSIAAVYRCNPATTIKVKAGTSGTIYASVKQQMEKKFAVVGSAEIPSTLSAFQFGVNATLG